MNNIYYKPTHFILLLIVAVLLNVTGSAAETIEEETSNIRSYQVDNSETQNQEDRGRHRHKGGPFMKVLDTDKDRALSADEIAAASSALLTLDKNGDGMLSHSELRPGPPPSGKGDRQHQSNSYEMRHGE